VRVVEKNLRQQQGAIGQAGQGKHEDQAHQKHGPQNTPDATAGAREAGTHPKAFRAALIGKQLLEKQYLVHASQPSYNLAIA
jgi:hypothetical protein